MTDCVSDRGFSRDSTHLRSIFPDEIWMEILGNITDSDTLEAVSNSSLFFRNLLLPRRTSFLFPKVFKNLENNSEHEVSSSEKYKEWLGRIQSLRLVCRQWSQQVDEFYENLPIHFEMDNDDKMWDVLPASNFRQVRGRFQSMNQFSETRTRAVQRFRNHFDGTHCSKDPERNPFFGRTVLFIYRDERSISGENNDYNSLLTKYGKHIWYCKIRKEGFTGWINMYSKIESMLQRMPNLKVLDICAKGSTTIHFNDFGRGSIRGAHVISESPLPTLKSLQVAKMNIVPVQMLKEFIRSNNHVSTLQFTGFWDHRDENNIYTVPFPKLTAVSMHLFSEISFQQLQDTSVSWNLSKLNLNMRGSPFLRWSIVFDLLQSKWKNTLTHLTLSLPYAKNNEQEETIMIESLTRRLHLPHLTHLSLIISNFASLDFILPLRTSLEFLNVANMYAEQDYQDNTLARDIRRDQTIYHLHYCPQVLLRSNMWPIFKKLQVIKGSIRFRNMLPVASSWERRHTVFEVHMTRGKVEKAKLENANMQLAAAQGQ